MLSLIIFVALAFLVGNLLSEIAFYNHHDEKGTVAFCNLLILNSSFLVCDFLGLLP